MARAESPPDVDKLDRELQNLDTSEHCGMQPLLMTPRIISLETSLGRVNESGLRSVVCPEFPIQWPFRSVQVARCFMGNECMRMVQCAENNEEKKFSIQCVELRCRSAMGHWNAIGIWAGIGISG